MQRVVHVVRPGAVEPHPAERSGPHDLRVVEIALRDQVERPPLTLAERTHGVAELAQERLGGGVDDAVDRVEAEPVDVVLVEPVQGVPGEVAPHLVALRAVDVDGLAPRRVVAVGQVRREALEVVALGPEVVVDDVEDDREAPRVAGVDEAPQPVGPAVGRLRRPQIDPVVAPVARAGELRDGHQLAGGDAEGDEVVETLDRTVERARLAERPDVQLVQHELGERGSPEGAIAPGERGRVDDRRGAVHAVGLRARRGVRQIIAAVQAVAIGGSRRDRDGRLVVPERILPHGHDAVGAEQVQLGARRAWRPDPEPEALRVVAGRAERPA